MLTPTLCQLIEENFSALRFLPLWNELFSINRKKNPLCQIIEKLGIGWIAPNPGVGTLFFFSLYSTSLPVGQTMCVGVEGGSTCPWLLHHDLLSYRGNLRHFSVLLLVTVCISLFLWFCAKVLKKRKGPTPANDIVTVCLSVQSHFGQCFFASNQWQMAR